MTNNDTPQTETSLNRRKDKTILRRLSKPLLVISSFLCFVLFFAYILQPDFCAAVTFWPIWIWAIPGMALSLAAIGVNKMAGLAVTFVWLLLVGFIAEEPLGLLRSCIYFERDCNSACTGGNCLRVISLNCAGGNLNAAEELYQYIPDIVLIQESPPLKDLKIFVEKLFTDGGEFVMEGDTAILARGRVTKTEVSNEHRLFMTGARVFLFSGLEIETFSVHLPPPVSGTNLFSSDCWQEHRDDRRMRLQKIAAIREHLGLINDSVPLVVGGDFNASPWTQAAKILSPRLYDSFGQGGIGWPGTAPAHLPLWRVDQIWTSRHFKTVKVWSENCKHSDHRIVICDLCRL